MIILNTNELLDAAAELAEADPAGDLAQALDGLEAAIVAAVEALGVAMAQAEGVGLHSVTNEPGFGGLCAAFMPGEAGKTSDTLAAHDQGGEW